MYIRQIPDEHLAEVREIMQRNKSVLLMPYTDLKRLFYFYYRFVKVIRNGQDAIKLMEKELSCPACKGKVIMYFRNLDL
jgi:hypothetical protein